MNRSRNWLVAAVSVFVLAATLVAADKIDLKDVKCVVNPKGPAKAGTEVAYKGGQVFFCCNNCPKAFQADTAKFATRANHQLVATKQVVQGACPLSGGKLNADATVKVAGATVAFCCENCQGKVAKAEGDAQLELVFSDAAFTKAKFAAPKKDQE